MKKLLLFFFTMFALVDGLQAQDLIVTADGDSINCRITKTTAEYSVIFF
jgi:hypothetical protein